MKITEIRFTPFNDEKMTETNKVEGDFSLLYEMLTLLCKKYDRQNVDYIFKVENAPANFYKFNLKNSEFNSALKLIPNLQSTW